MQSLSGRRSPRERRWVAGWVTGSVIAPIPAVLSASGDLGRSSVAGNASRSTRRSQGSSAQELSCRLSVPGSRTPGGTTGGPRAPLPPARRPAGVPDVYGGLLAILATEYADGSAAEYAIPTRVRPAGPSKPPNRPTRSGPRSRGWPRRRLGRGRAWRRRRACREPARREMSPGVIADPSSRTSRTPRSSSTASRSAQALQASVAGEPPRAGAARRADARAFAACPGSRGLDRAIGAARPSRPSPPHTPMSRARPSAGSPRSRQLTAALGGPAAGSTASLRKRARWPLCRRAPS